MIVKQLLKHNQHHQIKGQDPN